MRRITAAQERGRMEMREKRGGSHRVLLRSVQWRGERRAVGTHATSEISRRGRQAEVKLDPVGSGGCFAVGDRWLGCGAGRRERKAGVGEGAIGARLVVVVLGAVVVGVIAKVAGRRQAGGGRCWGVGWWWEGGA